MTPLWRLAFSSLGVATALTAGSLAFLLLKAEPPGSATVPESDEILVARRPIQSGARIAQADLEWQDMPLKGGIVGSIVRSRQTEHEIIGSTTLRSIATGEVIRKEAILMPPPTKTVAASLNPGWRAVTVTTNIAQASGVLRANDRVDLLLGGDVGAAPTVAGPMGSPLAALEAANGARQMLPERTLTNIRVIAINGSIGASVTSKDDGASPSAISSISFEVLPAQVGAIVAAASAGQLTIALRSSLDRQVSTHFSGGAKPHRTNKLNSDQKTPSGRSLNTKKNEIDGGSGKADTETVTIIRGGGSSRDR